MTKKDKTVSPKNRVHLADLGKYGTFRMNCGHRELQMMESMLNTPITQLRWQSVREIDCAAFCMVAADAEAKGTAFTKEGFKAALDNLNGAQYSRLSREAAACFAAAFDVPEDGEEPAKDAEEDGTETDEKNAESPADGTGTEAW